MSREMKYTNTEWLKDIPTNWKISKINALYSLRNEKVSDRDYPPLSVTMKGILPQIETAAKTNAHDDRKLVLKGDFAINSRSDRRGSCGISEYDGSVSLINTVMKPNGKMDPGYYNWLFHTTEFADEFYKWGHGIVDDLWTTNWQDMKHIDVPVPPLTEQHRIADFLDSKCSQIDEISKKIQEEIDTLEEYKKSVITEVVTKGLDPNVEMKDSNNPWYSAIPEKWKIMKTLYVLSQPITDGPHTTPELFDDGVPFVSAEAVSFGKGGIDFDHIRGYISEEFYELCSRKYVPQKQDVYMIKSGATTGRVSIVTTDRKFTIWSPLAVFRCNELIMNPKFLFYALQSAPYQNQVQDGWSYGTQQNIGMRTLEQLRIAVPSIAEQNDIVEYLDNYWNDVSSTIEAKQKQLTTLEEYKKSLIYEYVTGKKEVA